MKLLEIVVIGLPNAGKSTLINAIMKNNSIFPVSNKPHTTRQVNLASMQYQNTHIVLFDTPGLSNSSKKDMKYMSDQAKDLANRRDVCIFLFDVSKPLSSYLQYFANTINVPKIALLNKVDCIKQGKLLPIVDTLKDSFDHIIPISALKGINIDYFLEIVNGYATRDSEQEVFETNRSLMDRVKDRTYEAILHYTYNEIPYSVRIDNPEIITKEDGSLVINQSIFVKPSHYPIILGKDVIKNISVKARMGLIDMFKKNVHYFISVYKDKNFK
jgi:GTP-binding protein Era